MAWPVELEGSNTKRTLFASCALLAASGCATAPSPEQIAALDYGSYPENYEEIVLAHLQRTLKDPESARIRLAAGPATRWQTLFGEMHHGWRVCYYINAKNSYGGYTGEHLYYFIVREGSVVFKLAEETQPTIWDKLIRDACI